MKKKAVILVVLGMITTLIYYSKMYNQMDIGRNIAIVSGNYYCEEIQVYLGRFALTGNEEAIAQTIIKKVIRNEFPSVDFDFSSSGYPNELKVTVYKKKEDIALGNKLFSFYYGAFDKEGEYCIMDSEHMKLHCYLG